MANNIIDADNDFVSQWEQKKKENESFHKKAHQKILNMCVFIKEKIIGK